jgi:MFS family permease
MTTFASELRGGWRELLGAAIGLGCGIGCYTPVSSLFFRALEQEFSWSRSAAAASLLALPATALVLPAVGWLVDRLGVRTVALASSLMLAVCFFGLSTMTGPLAPFYAWFLALNVLGAGAGPVSYTRVVAQRFVAGRGAALGLALVGIAACGVLLPPVITHALADAGWRAGYRLLGCVALIGGLAAFLCIRPSPPTSTIVGSRRGSIWQAVASRAFWCLGLAIFCVSAASIGLVSQFQSLLMEKGLTAHRAGWLLSLLAGSVLISRLIIGRALDSGAPRRVAAITMVIAAIGTALFIGTPSFPIVLVGVVLLGLSIGGELDLMSFFCARSFGLHRYGTLYGALSAFFYSGMASGGLMYGLTRDRTGDYHVALASSSLLLLGAASLFVLIPEPKPEHDIADRVATSPDDSAATSPEPA